MLADQNGNEEKILASEYQKAANSETGQEFDHSCTTEANLGIF